MRFFLKGKIEEQIKERGDKKSEKSYKLLTRTSPVERITNEFLIHLLFFFSFLCCILHVFLICIHHESDFFFIILSDPLTPSSPNSLKKKGIIIIIKRIPWSFPVNNSFCLHSAALTETH